jgi:hypothetical protein
MKRLLTTTTAIMVGALYFGAPAWVSARSLWGAARRRTGRPSGPSVSGR